MPIETYIRGKFRKQAFIKFQQNLFFTLQNLNDLDIVFLAISNIIFIKLIDFV
jgi:hypothetical protein